MALHAVFLERKPHTRTYPASPYRKLRFSPCSRHIPQKTLVDEMVLEQSTVFFHGDAKRKPRG
jgi:hypothetical protein